MNVTFPVPDVKLRSRAVVSLSTLAANTMLPIPVSVPMATSPLRVTDVAKAIWLLVVAMSPASSLAPTPFCVKPPTAVMSPAAAVANTPALLISTVPPALMAAFTFKTLPLKSRLPPKLTTPPSVVIAPTCWVRLAAVITPAVTASAETMLSAPNAALAPTEPLKVISPVPEVNVSPRGVPTLSLFSVPEKVMSPKPAPVLITRSPPSKTAGPLTEIVPPAAPVELVSTAPPMRISLPVKLTAPPAPIPTPWAVVLAMLKMPWASRVIEPATASAAVASPLLTSVPVLTAPLLAVVLMLMAPPFLYAPAPKVTSPRVEMVTPAELKLRTAVAEKAPPRVEIASSTDTFTSLAPMSISPPCVVMPMMPLSPPPTPKLAPLR